MSQRVAALLSISLFVLAIGCRDDDDNSGRPDGGTGGDGGTTEHSIYDIQSDDMPVGTAVTVRGVIVTAIDTYGGFTGDIYVMEPDGGPYSGVFVYRPGSTAASLSVGDVIDIEGGIKVEHAFAQDTSGRTLTQIAAPQGGSLTLTKTGTGTVPEPELLDPWTLATDDDEAEKWEGVLVRFANISVLSNPSCIGSECPDPTRQRVNITGPLEMQSSLTAFPDGLGRGDCLGAVTGVVDYAFGYKILPRSAADYGDAGTECPAQEEGDAACADEIDNDYDGFIDCADFSCVDTAAACSTSTSVVDIQNGTVPVDTTVQLSEVVVTGLSFSRKYLWVQDQGGAALYNGVYVYRGASGSTDPVADEIQIGAVVNIQGRVDEFDTTTQVVQPTITFVSAGATPAVLTGVDYVALADDATAEPYEGVLVELSNVKVLSVDSGANSFKIGDAQNQVEVDDFIYRHTSVTVGDCYATLRGIVHRYSGTLQLLPRSAADIVTGGTCD